jgi:hypothetical protein
MSSKNIIFLLGSLYALGIVGLFSISIFWGVFATIELGYAFVRILKILRRIDNE